MLIVKIPGINGLGKTQGCEKAPNEIFKALKEIHSNEQGIPIDVKLFDLEEIHLDNSNIEEAGKLMHKNSLNIFEGKQKTIFLGGDHSISFSIGKAFLEHCKKTEKEPGFVIFDAHADAMQPMKEPTHEEWLRALVEAGFPKESILLVGARNFWKSEIEFLKENKIKTISMNQLREDLHESCDTIMEFSRDKELYISIDIDIIDPAFAPATGYQEPGGLTAREFIYMIQRINKIKNLRAVDIVEINPEKDESNLTVKLGAKVLSELV